MEEDRQKLLEEAAEPDHIWGIWEEEADRTSDAAGWLRKYPSTRETYGTMLRHEYHTGNNGSHRHRRRSNGIQK